MADFELKLTQMIDKNNTVPLFCPASLSHLDCIPEGEKCSCGSYDRYSYGKTELDLDLYYLLVQLYNESPVMQTVSEGLLVFDDNRHFSRFYSAFSFNEACTDAMLDFHA